MEAVFHAEWTKEEVVRAMTALLIVLCVGCSDSSGNRDTRDDLGVGEGLRPDMVSTECCYDRDGDGYGEASAPCRPYQQGVVTKCGDCDDQRNWVYPGADKWASEPIDGPVGTKGYDYDCNKKEDMRYTDIAFCPAEAPCATGAKTGWMGGPSQTKCGAAGTWVKSCYTIGTNCYAELTTKTQECK